ncbi:hypothetical protein QP028_05050 [Corynebacterium suedekumii]|nr:hypothetical protein QP028_05050 [Corynebacterium suedekumii]
MTAPSFSFFSAEPDGHSGEPRLDLVLPVFFRDVLPSGSAVALIGAAPGVAANAGERITRHRGPGVGRL